MVATHQLSPNVDPASQSAESKLQRTYPKQLVGRATETDIWLNGQGCKALLDTGATVSTVSEAFYREHLPDVQLHPLEDLNIECAAGQRLPFLGYVEVKVEMERASEIGVQYGLFLVVPGVTQYSRHVPVILGTNILQYFQRACQDKYGERYLQKAHLPGAWHMTFYSMAVEQRAVNRAEGRLGIVRCAVDSHLVIPKNSTRVVPGLVDTNFRCTQRTAMLYPSKKSTLPEGVEITPLLVNFASDLQAIEVEISNATSQAIALM